jgi:hypothetical protein
MVPKIFSQNNLAKSFLALAPPPPPPPPPPEQKILGSNLAGVEGF